MNADRTSQFEINGREVEAFANETLIAVADREGIEIPRLCYKPGMEEVGNCRSCMVEIDGERVLAPSCCRYPDRRHEGQHRQHARRRGAEDGARTADVRHAGNGIHAPQRSSISGPASWRWAGRASPRARQRAARRFARRHHRQPRRLHPVHPLRARLPRRAGQRRDRLRLPRRRRQDRVRHGRPDGQLHLRGLRRMRAGLPDRRPDAGARSGADGAGQEGRFGLPVLRRGLPADLQRQGQQDPVRRRTRRPGQPRPPVRQGPLRLRLRAPPAPPDQAADPPRRRAEDRRLHDGPGPRDGRVPRSDLGRSAGAGRRQAGADPRHLRQALAGRLRLGQGQQRGSLPVPEAGAHRLRQQQRRPLHAPVPRLVGSGAAGRDRLGRGIEPGDGRDARRGGDRHRRQPDRQPPGGGDLDQERRSSTAPSWWCATRAARTWRAARTATCSSSPTPTSRCSTR